MRFPKNKVSTRATALALVLGVVGVLVTAMPAWAAVPVTGTFSPLSGPPGTAVIVSTGSSGFLSAGTPTVRFNGIGGALASSVSVASDTQLTAVVPCAATDGPINVANTDGNDNSAANFDVTPATAPTISSFTPTSGPVGTSVVITGTNLCNATQVVFNTQPVISYTVTSATSITATVPTGATTGPIRVTTPGFSQVSSVTNYTVAAVPTITSFSPTSGQVGTSVTITGTNLTGVTSVRFNGVTATFSASTATSVTATVPTTATTGTISVTTPGGTATSVAIFTVTTGPVARTVSFGFEQNSRVSGHVNVTNGTSACGSFVPVTIQKQKNGSWKWVDTTATNGNGNFKTYIPPSNGKFRAKVNKLTLANGVLCGGDASNVAHS